MKNKINVAELLKDCPQGMELDCTMYENTSFIGITESVNFPIRVKINFGNVEEKSWTRELNLTSEGKLGNHPNAKCIIFPKGKTTWEGFVPPLPPCQFKDGDVIVDRYGAVAIYKRIHSSYEGLYVDFYCGITSKNRSLFIKDNDSLQHCGEIDSIRLATEEEKQELFKVIKDRGYRWNAETKTLEKLPKFKVGNRVRSTIVNSGNIYTVLKVEASQYVVKKNNETGNCNIYFDEENNFELVPNKFDINTLVPFESKVLVRNDESQRWLPAFWGYKVVDGFITTFGWCKYCIPYKGNENLFKTNNDCDKFFKVWEE
jgi:hypothetical protein